MKQRNKIGWLVLLTLGFYEMTIAQTLYVPNNTAGISTSTNAGNVGIGTSAPNAPFDIFTNTPTQNSYNSQRWSTVNSNYHLTLKTVWSNDGLNYNFVQAQGGTEVTSLSFFKGLVGIATSLPNAQLDVFT